MVVQYFNDYYSLCKVILSGDLKSCYRCLEYVQHAGLHHLYGLLLPMAYALELKTVLAGRSLPLGPVACPQVNNSARSPLLFVSSHLINNHTLLVKGAGVSVYDASVAEVREIIER